MLISVRHLVDRARHPRRRADELRSIRSRLAEQPGAAETGRGLVALALKLRRLRRELSAALAGVRSCSSCAVGYPEPFGHWDGGHCCGGNSENLFTNDELAALKAKLSSNQKALEDGLDPQEQSERRDLERIFPSG